MPCPVCPNFARDGGRNALLVVLRKIIRPSCPRRPAGGSARSPCILPARSASCSIPLKNLCRGSRHPVRVLVQGDMVLPGDGAGSGRTPSPGSGSSTPWQKPLRQGDGSELLRRTPGKEDALPVHPLQEASHYSFIAPRVLQHPPGSAPAGGSALVLVGSIPSRSWNGPPGRLSPVPASRASMSRARSSAGQEGRTDARSMQGLSRSRGRTSRASARGMQLPSAARTPGDGKGYMACFQVLAEPTKGERSTFLRSPLDIALYDVKDALNVNPR